MIKNIMLLVTLICVSLPSYSQTVTLAQNDSGEYFYQEVISIDSTNQQDLYDKLHQWVAKTYVSANDVIQYNDKDTGKIIAKGLYKTTNYGWEVYLRHTLTLEAKDNRFRVTFDQLAYQGGPDAQRIPFEKSVPRKKKMLERLEENIQSSVDDLVSNLTTRQVSDW